MIQHLGLPWAFRILAIAQFTANMVSAILLKDRNKQIGTTNRAFDYRLLKKFEYWLILGWGCFSMLGYVTLLFSLPNYATSIGLTAHQGAVVGALLNLAQGLGRPVVGYFSDASGRINMSAATTFSCGLFCFFIWTFAKTFSALIIFALMVGTVSGTFWAVSRPTITARRLHKLTTSLQTVGPVVTEVLGLRELGSGLAIVWLALVIPTTFAEAIALNLRVQSGDVYLRVQMFTGTMYVCAAICMWSLRAWKIGDKERAEAYCEKKIASDSESDSSRAPSPNRPATPAESSLLRRLTMPACV